MHTPETRKRDLEKRLHRRKAWLAANGPCPCGSWEHLEVQRLAHGWKLYARQDASRVLLRDFIRPAVRAVPPAMAHQLGLCRVAIVPDLGSRSVASQWSATAGGLEISVAAAGRGHHDIALELLLCLGQALWDTLEPAQRKPYWLLVDEEIGAGIPGEIDDDALRQKKALLAGRSSAVSRRRLEQYGMASFAGTVAEYVHCLWHEVTVRSGPACLPAPQLRRRLELLSRWYPPARGRRLFPAE